MTQVVTPDPLLRYQQDQTRDNSYFHDSGPRFKGQVVPTAWGATAWSVVPHGVDTIVRGVDGHLVGEGGDREEEFSCRDYGLEESAHGVAIALGIDFFKVERPVAQARG